MLICMTERYLRKVGAKGQVVVAKELREKHGIIEGRLVEQKSTHEGVLLVPISADDLLRALNTAVEEIGKTWPEEVSAVEAIKEDRVKNG